MNTYKLTTFFLRKIVEDVVEILSLLFDFELLKAAYDWVTDYRDVTTLKYRTTLGCSGQPFNRDRDRSSDDNPPSPGAAGAVRNREAVNTAGLRNTDLTNNFESTHPSRGVSPRDVHLNPRDQKRVERAIRQQRERLNDLDLNGPMPDGLSGGE